MQVTPNGAPDYQRYLNTARRESNPLLSPPLTLATPLNASRFGVGTSKESVDRPLAVGLPLPTRAVFR